MNNIMLEDLISKYVCTLLYSHPWLEEIFEEFFCQLKPTTVHYVYVEHNKMLLV